MILQQPSIGMPSKRGHILCHKCGAEIAFSKDHISPITKRKIPLDPWFNNEPHAKHCMYNTAPAKTDTDTLFLDFLSLVPKRRQRRIIGAVGKAK